MEFTIMAYNTPQTWSLLSTQTFSGASAVEFKSLISSNYSVYKFLGVNLSFSASGGEFRLQFSTDNGSTYVNSGYLDFFYYHDTTGVTGVFSSSSSDLRMQTVIENSGLQSTEAVFYNLNSSNVPTCLGTITHNDSLGGYNNSQYFGLNTGTTAITALKCYPDTGTFSGTFYFYGGNFN